MTAGTFAARSASHTVVACLLDLTNTAMSPGCNVRLFRAVVGTSRDLRFGIEELDRLCCQVAGDEVTRLGRLHFLLVGGHEAVRRVNAPSLAAGWTRGRRSSRGSAFGGAALTLR